MTHCSVRLKGTEDIFEPVVCLDGNCSKRYVSHMHCPFCSRTDFFTDTVILRAHYRVKHVDKGIDFAGLKILRCCDRCDIVGSIKGSKEIKGAHWHCYRCKNGFNRRDEALKHFRTHFRNPQTTFQIQLTQDVNCSHSQLTDDLQTIQTAQVTQQVDIVNSSDNPERGIDSLATTGDDRCLQVSVAANEIAVTGDDRCLQVSVAANETVDTTSSGGDLVVVLPNGTLANVIVDADDCQETNLFYSNDETTNTNVWSEQTASSKSSVMRQDASKETTADEDDETREKRNVHLLQIQELQMQVERQKKEIETLRAREVDLVGQLEVHHSDDKIAELLRRLKTEHEELLDRQLADLRREYLRLSGANPPLPLTSIISSRLIPSVVSSPFFILNSSSISRGHSFRVLESNEIQPTSSSGFTFETFVPDRGFSLLPGTVPPQEGEEEEEEDVEDTRERGGGGCGAGDDNDEEDVNQKINFVVTSEDVSQFVEADDSDGNGETEDEVGLSDQPDAVSVSDRLDLDEHVEDRSKKRTNEDGDCHDRPVKRDRI